MLLLTRPWVPESIGLGNGQGRLAVARRAHVTVTLIEHDEEITLHFEDERFPPLWFKKTERPVAYAKLKGVLDEIDFVEEVPVYLAS
jgi:hypothetical protein